MDVFGLLVDFVAASLPPLNVVDMEDWNAPECNAALSAAHATDSASCASPGAAKVPIDFDRGQGVGTWNDGSGAFCVIA